MKNLSKFFYLTVIMVMLAGLVFQVTPARASTTTDIQNSIDDGLAYLAGIQNVDGSWTGTASTAITCAAVSKFQDRAYELGYTSPWDPDYPYTANVTKAYEYIFAHAWKYTPLAVQPAGNPDTNGNGYGVYFATDEESSVAVYETGLCLMAMASSKLPDQQNEGGKDFDGNETPDTFGQLSQEGVDFLAWAQNEAQGGWRYGFNSADSDTSVTGFATLGLAYAENFGATVPAFVKTELNRYITYIQCADGGAGYTDCPGSSMYRTGHLITMMSFVGDTPATPRMNNALTYIESNWALPMPDASSTGFLGTWSLMKGLAYSGVHLLNLDGGGTRNDDWYNADPTTGDDLATYTIGLQQVDGGWGAALRFEGSSPALRAAFALLVLEKASPPPPNAPPVADNDSYSTPMNTLLNGATVLNGDTDAEGSPLTAIKVTDPTSGTLNAFNADGTFTYTPAAGFVGQATFTYKANDGSADSNIATVTIDVVNTPPTITEGTETTVTMSEDSAPVPFALTLHATDPDGDPLTWSLQTTATYGSASINATSGVVSYSPFPHYYGNDSFIVTVTDGRAVVPFTVNVVVTPVNDPILEANSYYLIYNNWRNNESAGYLSGNFITSQAGRLVLAIPANKGTLTLVVSKGPDQGIMTVQVDGVTVRNVDLYNATLIVNNNVVVTLPVGSKKVTIIASGLKNALSTNTWVRLDAYRFNTDPLFNSDLNLALWSNFLRVGHSNYRATTQPGKVVLEFRGQVIGWSTYRGPDAGMVEVYVDGVYIQTVDLYNATALWDQVYTFGPYTYGLHTIEFRVLATKNPASTGTRVIMDQIDKE